MTREMDTFEAKDPSSEKGLEPEKPVLSRREFLRLALFTAGFGGLQAFLEACTSVSAAPQGRPLPPDTPVVESTRTPEPTKPSAKTPEPTKAPTPVPEAKAVTIPAELKNASKEAIAGWMAEGGTQLAILSRGDNITGKLYYINGSGGIKEAPIQPSMVYTPKGEKYNIKMNKETGEVNAFYSDYQKGKFIPVKLDQTSGDKWVDVKTGEFVWGNVLGTAEPEDTKIKDIIERLGTWDINAELPNGRWQPAVYRGVNIVDVHKDEAHIFRAVLLGAYSVSPSLYEVRYSFKNVSKITPNFICKECEVTGGGEISSKIVKMSLYPVVDDPDIFNNPKNWVSLAMLKPGTIVDLNVRFEKPVEEGDFEAKLRDEIKPPFIPVGWSINARTRALVEQQPFN